MNIYVAAIARERAALDRRRVEDALARAAAFFPGVAGEPVRSVRSVSGRAMISAVSHGTKIAHPRRYLAELDDTTVTYDGRPLSSTGLECWEAGVLARNFERLAADLDGSFTIVRMTPSSDLVEVLTDPLGNTPAYLTSERDGITYVSNSLLALWQLRPEAQLDGGAISTFLCSGRYGDGRTALAGIEIIPGGSLCRVSATGRSSLVSHYGTEALRLLPRRGLPLSDALDALAVLLQSAATCCRPLMLGLTGGMDSRLCLALAEHAQVDVELYSEGSVGTRDIDVARAISAALGVPHTLIELRLPDADEVRQRLRMFIGQGDGLSDLSQFIDALAVPEPPGQLQTKILGHGGEIAKGSWSPRVGFLTSGMPAAASQAVQLHLALQGIQTFGGLVRDFCRRSATDYVERWFADRKSEGWKSRSLAEVWWIFERTRPGHIASSRRAAPSADLVLPLATRPFIDYAMSLTPDQRYIAALHYDALDQIDPRLLAFPFDKPPPTRNRHLASITANLELGRSWMKRRNNQRRTMGDENRLWLSQRQAHLAKIEEVGASPIFDFVDREMLIEALAPDGTVTSGVLRALTLIWWHEVARPRVASSG